MPESTQNQNIQYSVPVFSAMPSSLLTSGLQPQFSSILPSPSVSNARGTSTQLIERENNRKDKKKELERLRRSKINNQIKTMYDYVFKMSGETNRKTEICEMLADCLTVIKSVFKIMLEDEHLKSRILPPESLSSSKVSGAVDEEKENVPQNSNILTFSPISVNPSSVQSTSTPIECRGQKRKSVDSGLEQSHPSTSSSFPNSSISLSHETPPIKKSKITPNHTIWRPYQD